MRVDNENVRGAKNCLETDLGELAAKRKEIEALQATLYQLLSQKSSGKVDVKELKAQLAESVRHTRLQKPAGVFRSKRGKSARQEVPHWFAHLKENLATRKVM